MSRDITATIAAACAAQQVAPAYLVEMLFDSAPLRVWSGRGPITWGSKTFTGTGDYGNISEVEESSKIAANGIELRLSGIPSSAIALALSEPYRGRRVYVWLAFFNTATEPPTLLANPVPVFAGRMDVMKFSDEGQSASISVACESKLIDLERPRERRYTHEDQKELYANDRGLEYVSALQEKEIFWGRKG